MKPPGELSLSVPKIAERKMNRVNAATRSCLFPHCHTDLDLLKFLMEKTGLSQKPFTSTLSVWMSCSMTRHFQQRRDLHPQWCFWKKDHLTLWAWTWLGGSDFLANSVGTVHVRSHELRHTVSIWFTETTCETTCVGMDYTAKTRQVTRSEKVTAGMIILKVRLQIIYCILQISYQTNIAYAFPHK